MESFHSYLTGDLRLKKAIFREADCNPDGEVAALTKKFFVQFILPVGLKNGDWIEDGDSSNWHKNAIVDVQISRTIRHVLREENARGKLFHDHPEQYRVLRFRDNESMLAEKRDV